MNKIKNVIFVLMLFIISFTFTSNIYAKINKDSEWNVKIFGTKYWEKTNKVEFNVLENPDVVKGKIAPGLKATAKVTIDLTETKVPADIIVEIDDSNLDKNFKLTKKINGTNYNSGVYNAKNNKNELMLEIEWVGNGNNTKDTLLGANAKTISVPIKIIVEQQTKR